MGKTYNTEDLSAVVPGQTLWMASAWNEGNHSKVEKVTVVDRTEATTLVHITGSFSSNTTRVMDYGKERRLFLTEIAAYAFVREVLLRRVDRAEQTLKERTAALNAWCEKMGNGA